MASSITRRDPRHCSRMRVLPARISSEPHYVFHPMRAMRRMLRGDPSNADINRATAELSWGLPLEVYRRDAIGWSILTCGVFDPCVTETLYRLIDSGDVVIDVGANVGYMTSLAAARSGAPGRVVAYEPHPGVFELLARNVARWRDHPDVAKVEPDRAALSDRAGAGELEVGPLFHLNMGLATLHPSGDAKAVSERLTVPLKRLDAEFDGGVGLLKIDVEGHEPAVLRGARGLLDSRGVRDIVFEDHERYPSEATAIVEEAGYRLFSLENDLFGLRLKLPQQRGAVREWPGPSYLATCDPQRALGRLRPRGWRVAGIGPTFPRSRRRHSDRQLRPSDRLLCWLNGEQLALRTDALRPHQSPGRRTQARPGGVRRAARATSPASGQGSAGRSFPIQALPPPVDECLCWMWR